MKLLGLSTLAAVLAGAAAAPEVLAVPLNGDAAAAAAKAPPPAAEAPPDPFDGLMKWFQAECVPRGGYAVPGLSRSPVGLRGIVAPGSVKANATVLQVPLHCVIHASDAKKMLEKDFAGVLTPAHQRPDRPSGFDDDNFLELALLVTRHDVEYRRSSSSRCKCRTPRTRMAPLHCNSTGTTAIMIATTACRAILTKPEISAHLQARQRRST